MSVNGLTLGLTKPLCNGLGGGTSRQVSSAPSVPTTDLIHALPYPNGGTLPTWLATVGPSATVTDPGVNIDTGTGIRLYDPTRPATFTEVGPTANKPFTFVRVFKWVESWSYYTKNADASCYFASLSGGAGCFILSTNGGFIGGPPSSSVTSGYIVERIRRTSGGAIYYATTGVAEVLVASGQGASLFPISIMEGNNQIPVLSHFLYSGDAGDLTESGAWTQLASWISANNFGASL